MGKFRYKGRELGTNYGRREHQSARSQRQAGNVVQGVGAVSMFAGGAAVASGEFIGGGFAMTGGRELVRTGSQMKENGRATAAHGTAVESLIAKSRGGSAALGQKGIVPKTGRAQQFQPPMHLGGPKPKDTVDMRTPEGTPGPDGISPAARTVGHNIDAQREAWESMRANNPDLARQLDAEGHGEFKPQTERQIQDVYDAIHTGSHGRSNGAGSVWKEPMKLGGPKPPNSMTESPQPTRVQKKYSGARTKAGARIMGEAQGQRSASKFFKGTGRLLNMASPLGFASGGPAMGSLMLGGGMSAEVAGSGRASAAQDLRLKSRAVDNLITKRRTGTTVGANMTGSRPTPPPAPVSAAPAGRTAVHATLTFAGFNRANSGFQAAPAQGPDQSQSSGKRRGWSNQARINSAISRGAQNLPYGGNPDDGTGQ